MLLTSVLHSWRGFCSLVSAHLCRDSPVHGSPVALSRSSELCSSMVDCVPRSCLPGCAAFPEAWPLVVGTPGGLLLGPPFRACVHLSSATCGQEQSAAVGDLGFLWWPHDSSCHRGVSIREQRGSNSRRISRSLELVTRSKTDAICGVLPMVASEERSRSLSGLIQKPGALNQEPRLQLRALETEGPQEGGRGGLRMDRHSHRSHRHDGQPQPGSPHRPPQADQGREKT